MNNNISLVLWCRFQRKTARERNILSKTKAISEPDSLVLFSLGFELLLSPVSLSYSLWLSGDAFSFESFKKRKKRREAFVSFLVFWVSMSFSSSTMTTVVSKTIGVVLVMIFLLAILLSTFSFSSGSSLIFYLLLWIPTKTNDLLFLLSSFLNYCRGRFCFGFNML